MIYLNKKPQQLMTAPAACCQLTHQWLGRLAWPIKLPQQLLLLLYSTLINHRMCTHITSLLQQLSEIPNSVAINMKKLNKPLNHVEHVTDL